MSESDNGAVSQTTLTQVPAQPTAVNVWSDKSAFDQMTRVASMLSKSTLVPQNFQGKPEDCFIAVEMAARMNTSPIFIMQNLYVVKGKPSWAGQACMAMIMSCGKFKSVKHNYTGEKGTDSRGCYVSAVRIADGELVTGTEVTIGMAKSEGWLSNSKWKSMPEQMLGYRAASFFARMHCPEALMGLQTAEEVYDAMGSRHDVPEDSVLICEDCGEAIVGTKHIHPAQIAEDSRKKYGRVLCLECRKKQSVQSEEARTDDQDSGEILCEQCGQALVGYGKMDVNKLAAYTRTNYGRTLCAVCAKKIADEKANADSKQEGAQQTDEQ